MTCLALSIAATASTAGLGLSVSPGCGIGLTARDTENGWQAELSYEIQIAQSPFFVRPKVEVERQSVNPQSVVIATRPRGFPSPPQRTQEFQRVLVPLDDGGRIEYAWRLDLELGLAVPVSDNSSIEFTASPKFEFGAGVRFAF